MMTDVYVDRRDGKIVGYGPHPVAGNDGQPRKIQEIADSAAVAAEVAALDRSTQPDLSNLDNIAKRDKAILLAAATMSGRTPAQAKAAFKAAWDALP
jgi:hypothetical protein